jgi:hypothetical protein
VRHSFKATAQRSASGNASLIPWVEVLEAARVTRITSVLALFLRALSGGRKVGSRNRATLLADALPEGEQEELVRKGIELAKAGDPQMLKFFLDRILPKERW